MPFDPTLPLPNSEIESAVLRAQFNGLDDKINAIPAGPPGPEGPPGNDGAPGPPFAQAVVDAVNTLPPGNNATVDVTFDGTDVHFTFGLPAGVQGETGPPGEVTTGQLNDAIAGTAANPSGFGPWSGSFSDPPTQGEMQSFAEWAEGLRVALTRSP